MKGNLETVETEVTDPSQLSFYTLIELEQMKNKVRYSMLSEIEDLFVKNSKHKAYVEIQKKMRLILTKI